MKQFFYHMQRPLCLAAAFLLILSCMVTAGPASVRAEETMSKIVGEEKEQGKEEAGEEKNAAPEETGNSGGQPNQPEAIGGEETSGEEINEEEPNGKNPENEAVPETDGEGLQEEPASYEAAVGRNISGTRSTAYAVGEAGTMLRAVTGSDCTIRSGTAHSYGSRKTTEFEVRTGKGSYIGYSAQPNTSTISGTCAFSEETNERIKMALMFGADGPWAEEASGLFNGVDEPYPYIHAMIGAEYGKNTDGMTGQQVQDMRNTLDGLMDSGRKESSAFREYKAYAASLQGQDIVWLEYEGPVTGRVKLRKSSSIPDMTDGNPCYSLGGAEYGIYSDESCTTQVGRAATEESGESDFVELAEGDYWIKEAKAPRGYRKDGQAYPVHVKAGEDQLLDVSNIPENDASGLALAKWDQEAGDTLLPDGASLAGTQFTVRYYQGYYDRESLPRTPARTWVLETKGVPDVSGTLSKYQALLREEYKASGDDFYMMDGIPVLPLGTICMEETKAPQGYSLENAYLKAEGSGEKIIGPYITQICQEENGAALKGGNQYAMYDQAIRGGVRVRKRDYDTKASLPQGSAVLSDAVFAVVNLNDHAVVVDGNVYARNETVAAIVTDENGIAQTPDRLLPYGKYRVVETGAPTGYLGQGICQQEFSITKDGETADLTDAEHSILNRVKRGDFELRKLDAGTRKAMPDVPFRLTSAATGESHQITTDENGYYSSSSAWNKHTDHTNQGGAKDGLWFGLDGEGGSAPADDGLGALPYDTYILEELPSEANKGKEMITVSFVISEDKVTADLGNLENHDLYAGMPSISTSARNKATGNQYAEAGVVTAIDSVLYDQLEENQEYLLKCTPMDKETETPVLDENGNPVTAEQTFTAAASAGIAEVECTFDASGLAGKDIVLYEELYYMEEKIAEHKDIHDEGQTIHFPEIRTRALDKASGTNTAAAGEQVSIADTVFYKNLEPGQEYTLRGKLMDKGTGMTAQDAEGEDVTAETKFTPKEKDGKAEVEFHFDGSNLAGRTLVVFETLEENGKIYAVHADLDSGEQTIYFPKADTSAKDAGTDSRNARPAEDTVIKDTVFYSNLTPGQEYRAEGILMDKETEEPLLADGEKITAEAAFTPESDSGSVEVSFEFDASGMEGKTAVAFESVTREGKEVAAHKDIHYEEQTIYFPKLKTNAGEKGSGSRKITAEKEITILDKVTYQNLIPGEEYNMKGILMDKSTGAPLLTDKKETTAEKTFVPEAADGTVEVEFILDASALKNTETVIFEKLCIREFEIAFHEDLADESQTVRINMDGTPSEENNEEQPKEQPGEEPKEQPGEKPKEQPGEKLEEEPAPSIPQNAVKTGDTASILPAVFLFLLSLSVLIAALRKKLD